MSLQGKPKRYWGLDLAGLGGKNNSGLAMIESHNISATEIDVTIFRQHPFNDSIKGETRWSNDRLMEMVWCLQKWANAENHLYVDIPLEWQGLPLIKDPLFLWQTKKRVVDYVFGGLAPFAERLGSQTADFRYLANTAGICNDLGQTLFEAYPKATLRAILGENPPSKTETTKDYPKAVSEGFSISLRSSPGTDGINHDEIDAIICAIAGAGEFVSLSTNELVKAWKRHRKKPADPEAIIKERPDFFTPPRGYRVVPPAKFVGKKIRVTINNENWTLWKTKLL